MPMGTPIEINDTLKISYERGFPIQFNLKDGLSFEELEKSIKNKEFSFWNKDERLYHRAPTPVLLVQEMPDGKWVHWGRAQIVEQTIKQGKTEGKFIVSKLFSPEDRFIITRNLSPEGKSHF